MTKFIQIQNDNVVRTIHEHDVVHWDAENYCTPAALERDGKSSQFGVFRFSESVAPDFDPITQVVREGAPTLTAEGHYEQQWEVQDLPQEQVATNLVTKAEADARLVQSKIEALWTAADKYTSNYISGVAIGILTIGVLQQKPKALAVSAWSSSVWAEYYARKALVTATSEDNHDFSSFGPVPHTVPELQTEVGL